MAKKKNPFVVFSEKAKKKASRRWKAEPGMALLDKAVATMKKKKSGKKVLEAYGRSIIDPAGVFKDAAKRHSATKAVVKAGAAGFKAGKVISKHPESRRGSKD